jgi:hypothetical protein
MENLNGLMEDIILEISLILKCRAKGKCHGILEMAKKLFIKDNF